MLYVSIIVQLIFNRLDSFGPNFINFICPSLVFCFTQWCVQRLGLHQIIVSYICFTFHFFFLSSPCPIPDKMLISGGNSIGNQWNKISCTANFFWLIILWGKLSGIQQKNERLVSKETVMLCWRGSETPKFCVKQVDKSQISTVKRWWSWHFEH